VTHKHRVKPGLSDPKPGALATTPMLPSGLGVSTLVH